jgi:hypothetical protein
MRSTHGETNSRLRAGPNERPGAERPGFVVGVTGLVTPEMGGGDKPLDRRTLRLLLYVLMLAELTIVLVILSSLIP